MRLWLIKRWFRHLWQRLTRGWDDSDTWGLSVTHAQWIEPRLRRFKELNNGFPGGIPEEKWNEYLDKMIFAFSLIGKDLWDWETDKEKVDQVNEGLDLFRQWYFDLWW